jgi:hypothetical protein
VEVPNPDNAREQHLHQAQSTAGAGRQQKLEPHGVKMRMTVAQVCFKIVGMTD